LVPFGENATDETLLLCAFVFSLSSSSLPARATLPQIAPGTSHHITI
jgi:hypothetical protein